MRRADYRRARAGSAARARGFALAEMALVLALAMLAAIWASARLARQAEDAAAQAAGRWLAQVRQAAAQMLEQHFETLEPGQGAPGFADAEAPTLAELRAAGLLPQGFPDRSALGWGARVRVVRAAACPGEHCRLDALVHGDRPQLKPGTQEVDVVAMAGVMQAAGGYGGAVWPESPAELRGALFRFPNPPSPGAAAHPPGTVAAWAGLARAQAGRYVRMRDARDPDLQGGLSVAGSVYAGGFLVVQGRAAAGSRCGEPGAVARTETGALLSCAGGVWNPPDGGFGGAYAVSYPWGCRQPGGRSTANPRTGQCSCPAGYTPVVVSAGLIHWAETESWTTGYVCVR